MSARVLHGYFGLFFCAILIFLSASGTLAVFSVEIDWLARAEMRVEAAGEKAPVGRTFDAAMAAEPGAIPVALVRFDRPRFADRVEVVPVDRGARFVWVDPYSSEVRGTTSTRTFQETLRELHRALSIDKQLVRMAVAAVSLPLAVSIVTGLLLYRRFWTGFFRMPRWGGRRRAILSDLHRLIAVWLLPFLLIVGITSLVFLSEMVGLAPVLRKTPGTDFRNELMPPGFSGDQLDQAVALATSRIEGFELTDIQFPTRGNLPLSIRGVDGTALVRDGVTMMHIDPENLDPLKGDVDANATTVQPAAQMNARLRVFEGIRVVHYGTLAGLPTRILWVIFGLCMTTLGVLGSLVAVERLRKEFQIKGKEARSGLRHVMSGPGVGNWPGLLVISIAIVLAIRSLV
jgi:uncharacterized iron-regulated membrane protein